MGLCHTPTTLLILEIIKTNWKKTTTWLAYCHLHSWGIKTLHRGLFPPLTNSTQHWASAPSRFSQYPTSRLKGYLSIWENLGALGSDFCSAILSAWYPIEQYLFQTSFETCHHTTWGKPCSALWFWFINVINRALHSNGLGRRSFFCTEARRSRVSISEFSHSI